jgi:hypothetical protein
MKTSLFSSVSVLLLTLLPGLVFSQGVNYRCNCGEIGTYYNPIYIFRQVMGKYRQCWSPLFFNIGTYWKNSEFPDKVDFSTAFQCRDKQHNLKLTMKNEIGAFTLDNRYSGSQSIVSGPSGLEISEKKFPYFKASSFFNCQNIPEGKDVKYENKGPYTYPRMNYDDPCLRTTPVDILIETKTESETSSCSSKSWWYSEFDLLRGVHIFDFCKTPRVKSMQVILGDQNTGDQRLSSSLDVTYECDYGVEYSFNIEHRVSDKSDPNLLCRSNKVDVDPLFEAFIYEAGKTTCSQVYNFFIRKILG